MHKNVLLPCYGPTFYDGLLVHLSVIPHEQYYVDLQNHVSYFNAYSILLVALVSIILQY